VSRIVVGAVTGLFGGDRQRGEAVEPTCAATPRARLGAAAPGGRQGGGGPSPCRQFGRVGAARYSAQHAAEFGAAQLGAVIGVGERTFVAALFSHGRPPRARAQVEGRHRVAGNDELA